LIWPLLKFLVLRVRFMSRMKNQDIQKSMIARTVIHVKYAVIIDANYVSDRVLIV